MLLDKENMRAKSLAVAAVMGIEIANVRSELAAALRQLEAVMGTVAA